MTISLKLRNSVALSLMTGAYILALYLIFRMIILPGFISLETAEAKKNIRRPCQSILRETEHLKAFVHDWSAWTETYEFAKTKSGDYVETNIPFSTFRDNSINLILFSDASGTIFWQRAYDLKTEQPITIPEIPGTKLSPENHLIRYSTTEKELSKLAVSGLLMTSFGPLIVASRPILTNDNTGPARGSIIMGRFLDDTATAMLSRQTEADFKVIPAKAYHGPAGRTLQDISAAGDGILVEAISSDILNGYAVLPDIAGEPAIVVCVKMKREIARKGFKTMEYALFSVLAFGVVFLIIMYIVFDKIIIRPIEIMAKHSVDVGLTGDMSARLSFSRKDEIGILARQFDTMLSQLEKTRSTLVEQSYYAGLAGVASEILHNTRNMLNPVSGRLNAILDECRAVPFDVIEKAVTEFETGAVSSERSDALMRYINLSVRHFIEMSGSVKDALSNISEHIFNIETMLNDLDEYSRTKSPEESVRPEDIVRHSVTAIRKELSDRLTVTITGRIASLPGFMTEKITLLTVLSTICNHIVILGAETLQELIIDGYRESVTGRSFVHFKITGRGLSLSEEVRANLFEREDYDRKENHLIGLHWCSNVVSAMGGILRTEDEKQGDLVFHLSLPVTEETHERC